MGPISYAVILLLASTGGNCLDFLSNYPHLIPCYNESILMPHFHYPAQTLENLLSIIEKVERHPTFYSLPFSEIVLYLLINFRFDGIYKMAYVPNVGDRYYTQWSKDSAKESLQQLQHKMVLRGRDETTYKNTFPLDFFTHDEKCALHWMLSHSLNLTRRGEENFQILTPPPELQDTNYYSGRRVKRQQPGDFDYANNIFSRYPLERGIMSTPSGTVAPSLVLLGLAMHTSQSDFYINIGYILKDRIPTNHPLYAQTLDIRFAPFGPIAFAADRTINPPGNDMNGNKVSRLGPDGWWNNTVCPNEYILRFKSTSATDAQVYGALDGFHLATKLPDVTTSYQSLKLSHILRMYYNHGLFGELRACNRFKLLKDYVDANRQMLHTNVEKLIATNSLSGAGNIPTLGGAKRPAEEIIGILVNNYTEGTVPSRYQCTDLTTVIEPETIPLVDLYIVLDNAVLHDPIRYDEAATMIGELGNLLDISVNSSHMGIYINDVRLFDAFYPMNKTLPSAELKCKLKWLDHYTLLNVNQQPNMAETIKKLVRHFSERGNYEEQRKITKTPAKVILFSLSGQLRSRIEDIRYAMDLLRRDHPEVEVLATGSSSASIDAFVANSREDFFSYGSYLEARNVAQKIYERLQKVGSLLYYPDCQNWHTSRVPSIMIMSYIANNTRRFHTVPSKTFNASTDLKIDVRATYYDLKVCVSRSRDIFVLTNKVQCATVNVGSTSQQIFYNNPCNGLSRFCPPIYLRVETYQAPGTPPKGGPICTSDFQLCRTADEAPYFITISDAYCGCSAIKVTFSLLLSCLFSVIHRNFFA